MEISGARKQEAVSALVESIRAKARAKRASHLELFGILRNGTDQGVVGGDQAEAARRHLVDPLRVKVLGGVLPSGKAQGEIQALAMANGGWRKTSHPRELARELVSCSKGGTALFSKSGKRRKPSQIVPTDAILRSIKRAKAKLRAKWAGITHGIVYKLTSPSGKAYVGISKHSLEFRMRLHMRSNSYCKAIKAALRKYGEDAFKKELLHDNVPLAELGNLEVMEIERHGTFQPGGYNLTRGGEINPMDNPKSREKVSKSKARFWAGKSKEEKEGILAATQTAEVRKRATETKRARGLERAQARANEMGEEEGARYMERYMKNSERNRAKYEAEKLARVTGSSV
tara:strand:+ start:282 stop:1313 length:1032 start_codon:yes stop_codon:yes gene_type:complete